MWLSTIILLSHFFGGWYAHQARAEAFSQIQWTAFKKVTVGTEWTRVRGSRLCVGGTRTSAQYYSYASQRLHRERVDGFLFWNAGHDYSNRFVTCGDHGVIPRTVLAHAGDRGQSRSRLLAAVPSESRPGIRTATSNLVMPAPGHICMWPAHTRRI